MLKVAGGGATATGSLTYAGTWNASTNTPTLTSGVGNLNNYYVVNVAGTTTLDGISSWQVGDWAIFNGTVWERIDGGAYGTVSQVNTGTGLTGGPITSSGTISLVTPVAIANGGTNSTATPTSGAVAYGNGTSYLFTAAGTAGQYLQSTGSGAPTWSTPSTGSFQPAYYGTFVSTSNQANGGATTANAVNFDSSPAIANGISVTSGNQITFANAGIYEITYELAFINSTGGNPTITTWFAQQGTNITNSTCDFVLQGGANQPQIINQTFIVNVTAGQYIQIYWACSSTTISLTYQPALTNPTRPASPSAILNAVFVPPSGQNVVINSSTITGGTSGNILYDNAGTIGEKGVSGTGNVVLVTSSTLSNVNISSVAVTFPNSYLSNSTTTLGNATLTLGSTTSSVGNLTLANANITSVASTFPNSYLANSTATLGNATITLGGTTTSVGNLTLANANITSVAATFPNSYLANSTATLGNATITLGSTTSTVGNLTLQNVTISSVSTPITAAQGGTGLNTLTANNILIGNATGSVTFVAPGTSGNVLTSNGTVWLSQAAGSTGFPITLGNTSITASSTTTTVGNLTLNNVTIGSGNSTITTENASYINVSTAIRTQALTGYLYGNANTGNVTAATTIPNAGLANSTATLGNATITLGGTTTTVGNLTLQNVTISNVASTFPNSFLANSTATLGNATVTLGSTTSTVGNLTLTLPTVTNYLESQVAIGNSGTAQTLSLASGTVQTVTLTGNCTFTMPAVGSSKSFVLLINTGAGGFTATFTSVKWPANTAPTITTTASRWDIISFVSDGTNWYGNFAQGYA